MSVTSVRRGASFFVALCLITAGCGKGDESNPGEVKPVKETEVDRTVTLRVEGDRKVTFDGRLKVRVVLREAGSENLTMAVASVTFPTPHQLPDGLFVNPEVGLVGMYKGDGTYTVPAGIGPRPTTGPTVPDDTTADSTVKVSVVQVTTYRLNPTEETRFGYLLEPCKVTLDDDAQRGKADCPALVAHDGKRISMSMTWKP